MWNLANKMRNNNYNEAKELKAFWEENKKEFEADADYWRKNKDMSWILDIEFNNPKRLAIYKVYSKARIFLGSIKRRIIGG